MSLLTIGMATHTTQHDCPTADQAGAYFTISAIRANHPHVEILVVDNSPRPDTRTRDVCLAAGGRYYHKPNLYGTSAPRDEVFRLARTPWAMCVDSHVIFETGAIESLIRYAEANPGSQDLVQGPLIYDDGTPSTHWRATTPPGLWGVWDYDSRAAESDAFEIPMQGLGIFAMRTAAWPGFSPLFSGFGGEEGYLHELVRRRGGRAICLPSLRWRHWFRDPMEPVPYAPHLEDHVWNLLIGHRELGIDAVDAIRKDFGDRLPPGVFDSMIRGAEGCQRWNAPGERPTPMKVLGVWYSNNAAPPKVLKASLDSIKRAKDLSRADVTVMTCPWEPVAGNPFAEVLAKFKDGPGHLNIVRQQRQCVEWWSDESDSYVGESMQSLMGDPDVVCFLEHDVIYPPDYFDRVAKAFRENPAAPVVSNLDYEGLNATGWLAVRERHEPLHQLSMRYDVAVANLDRCEAEAAATGSCLLEPQGDRSDWVRMPPRGKMPSIHINHERRLTSHGEVVFNPHSNGRITHPFWGAAVDYWAGPEVAPTVTIPSGCGTCGGQTAPLAPPPPPPFATVAEWYEDAIKRPSDFHQHVKTLKELADQCEVVAELSLWDDKPATVALAASAAKRVVSARAIAKRIWGPLQQLRTDLMTVTDDGLIRDGVDLLFLDEHHRAEEVYNGLVRYAPHVRRYLVIHCTTDPYGETGDDGGPGVMPGVRRFLLENKEWTAIRHDKGNHGLMVMSRDDRDKKQPPNLIRQAMNFTKALTKHAVDGNRLVNDRVFELRLAECAVCPQRFGDKCGACGCPLDAKASWASESCGMVKIGREPLWVATSDPADLQ